MSDTGENPKDRLGLEKAPLRLNPAPALVRMSQVFELGAKKYGPYNWRTRKVKYSVYLEAAMRHILSALDGEDLDRESGQMHVAHAMACMAIVIDAHETGNLIDERPPKGVTADLIASTTKHVMGEPPPVKKDGNWLWDQVTRGTLPTEPPPQTGSRSDRDRTWDIR